MARITLLESGSYGFGLLTEQDAGCISAELNPEFMKEGFQMAKEDENGAFSLQLNCILQKADTKNRNDRVYPKRILMRESQKYQVLINERSALGECNHPNEITINLDNVSHHVVKIWWDGDTLYGKIELIVSEQYAKRGEIGGLVGDKLAHYLNKYKLKLGISSRGVGSVRNVRGLDEVQDDFELFCFDIVHSPSTPGAYLFREQPGLNESTGGKPTKAKQGEKINKFLASLSKN